MDGFLNILKPPGMTSNDVVVFLRKELNIRKIGHLGTLDPGAAGVLPVCIGKATKLAKYVVEEDKLYRAEITFGFSTDTLDKYGLITKTSCVKSLKIDDIVKVTNKFKGQIMQVPPLYSAKKINGKKLYKYARSGINVELKAYPVYIDYIYIIEYDTPYKLLLDIKCSKGTYIRALARDICKEFGMEGFMSMLIRTKVGQFKIEDAYTLEDIKEKKFNIIFIDNVITYPPIYLDEVDTSKIIHGQFIANKYLHSTTRYVKLYDNGKKFKGIGRIENDKIYIDRLLFGADD